MPWHERTRDSGWIPSVAPAISGLASLFEQHRTELLRFLRARCGDFGEADDLAQELSIRGIATPQFPPATPQHDRQPDAPFLSEKVL
ncbi:MAG: hypothetical protein M3N34_01220 [Pseudomonadota bacterium]|nr:hypothetical protein [Pseudomonadota bacterium]